MGTHARVGQQLKDYRAKYGFTQASLATSIGCSRSLVSKLELGIQGSMESMEALLWALGLELADLNLGRREVISINRGKRLRMRAPAQRRAALG